MKSKKMRQLMRLAKEQGYILHEDGTEIYANPQSVSRALDDLVDEGLFQVKAAPNPSKKNKIWELTEKGQVLLE